MGRFTESIHNWDGATVALLAQIAENHVPDQATCDEIVLVLVQGVIRAQDAATWVVLAWARRGIVVPTRLLSALIAQGRSLEGWMSRLHICQLVRLVEVPIESRHRLLTFLAQAARDGRPLVRAWALDARCHLTNDRKRRARLLAGAANDPAAAVRARARKLGSA